MRRWFFTALGMTLLLGLPGAGAVSLFQSPISANTESDGTEPGDVELDDGVSDDEVVEEPTTTTVVEPVPEPEPAPRPENEARPEGDQRAREALRRCLAHHNVRDIDRLLAEHSPRELLRRCMAHHRCERRDADATGPDAAPVDVPVDVTAQSEDVSTERPDRCRPHRRPGDEPPGDEPPAADSPVADLPSTPTDERPVAEPPAADVSGQAAGRSRR